MKKVPRSWAFENDHVATLRRRRDVDSPAWEAIDEGDGRRVLNICLRKQWTYHLVLNDGRDGHDEPSQ